MTREAKIGMLTGLGVIVLIGVLLSEYLGGGSHGAGMSPTGRMAALPMGAAYRQEVMQPVGVPAIANTDPGATVGNQTTVGGSSNMPAAPVAYASTDATGAPRMDAPATNGPAMNQPVAPVPAGNIQMDTPTAGLQQSVPTMQMPENGVQAVYVAGQPAPAGPSPTARTPVTLTLDGTVAPAAPAKVEGQEYVIAAGDNLAKIAKKFYKSAKNSDVERIVAANPAMLKNDKSMLIAGKKLIIPNAPQAIAAAQPAAAPAAPSKKAHTVIREPGTSGDTSASAGATPLAPTKKAVAKVYVVQANDTLEKIAKKIAPSNVNATVKKIMAANGIKDAKSLQVGMKLTLPAASA
jgi:nucleoid-associated protein YgaU